jgi:replicative DNA helicase
VDKVKVSIINLLQGAAAPVNGDKTDCINLASIALSRIEPKYVADEDQLIYDALVDSTQSKVVLDLDVLKDFLNKQTISDPDKLVVMRRFNEGVKKRADRAKFMQILAGLDYEVRRKLFEQKIFAASLALQSGYYDEETKIRYSGLEGAQELVSIAVSASSAVAQERFPSGDIRQDKEALFKEYADAVAGIKEIGVLSGFHSIDSLTDGFHPGEMILVGAFTSEGKSMMIVNMAHNAAIVQGRNVVVVTAETLRPQYRRRILGTHSCLPKFGLPLGIPSNAIKNGELDPNSFAKYEEVVADFCDNPNYGYLDVMQVTCGATLREIRRELEAVNANIRIDAVFLDYLSLIAPTRKRGKKQEETMELMREAKELAITFNGGKGIPIISAHQMSNQARDRVMPTPGKFYTTRDFADTSEAGKSADIAVALLRNDELEAQHRVCCGLLKNRDGELGSLFELAENYSAAQLHDLTAKGDTTV